MNVHSYEKAWLIAALGLIVLFIATITYGSVGLGIAMVDDEAGTIAPDEIDDHEGFGDPGVKQVGEDEYEVHVVAFQFAYDPSVVEVPEDSEVTFYVTSTDVIHSYSLAETNVNTMVIPGEIAEMTVEFDEPDEYGVVCNEYCGDQHHNMEGQVHVVPEDEFEHQELSVDAPLSVDEDEEVELTATVSNIAMDDHETTATFEIGDETVEEDLTVPAHGTESVTVTVDAADLGTGEHDWTVTVDDHVESGEITVEEGGDDDE